MPPCRLTVVRKAVSIIILVAFIGASIQLPSFAQVAAVDPIPFMPKPGVMVHLSPEFMPAYLKGIVIHPENALKFDFIIYKGDKEMTGAQKKEEYTKLTKYFLASLAIPDDDQWVNLSPYEKDRIIKDDFGKTEMGRDLLAQDYMLKQITASLIYPEDNLGKKFWERVYTQAQEQFGTTNIPVNTFNKVWILPDNALIYEKGNTAYVLKNHLRVMLEEDYLSLEKHTGIISVQSHSLASRISRQIVLPALEREVNEGKNFAPLRQVYSGMLLAAWYKRALKESLLSKIYANKARVKGVDQDPKTNEKIYQQYLKAYKKGVFNFIKEDVDKYTNETIPRKYFSGGTEGYPANPAMFAEVVKIKSSLDRAEIAIVKGELKNKDDYAQVVADVAGRRTDAAMLGQPSDVKPDSISRIILGAKEHYEITEQEEYALKKFLNSGENFNQVAGFFVNHTMGKEYMTRSRAAIFLAAAFIAAEYDLTFIAQYDGIERVLLDLGKDDEASRKVRVLAVRLIRIRTKPDQRSYTQKDGSNILKKAEELLMSMKPYDAAMATPDWAGLEEKHQRRIAESQTAEELKDAYKEMAKEVHPDKHPHDTKLATEVFQRLGNLSEERLKNDFGIMPPSHAPNDFSWVEGIKLGIALQVIHTSTITWHSAWGLLRGYSIEINNAGVGRRYITMRAFGKEWSGEALAGQVQEFLDSVEEDVNATQSWAKPFGGFYSFTRKFRRFAIQITTHTSGNGVLKLPESTDAAMKSGIINKVRSHLRVAFLTALVSVMPAWEAHSMALQTITTPFDVQQNLILEEGDSLRAIIKQWSEDKGVSLTDEQLNSIIHKIEINGSPVLDDTMVPKGVPFKINSVLDDLRVLRILNKSKLVESDEILINGRIKHIYILENIPVSEGIDFSAFFMGEDSVFVNLERMDQEIRGVIDIAESGRMFSSKIEVFGDKTKQQIYEDMFNEMLWHELTHLFTIRSIREGKFEGNFLRVWPDSHLLKEADRNTSRVKEEMAAFLSQISISKNPKMMINSLTNWTLHQSGNREVYQDTSTFIVIELFNRMGFRKFLAQKYFQSTDEESLKKATEQLTSQGPTVDDVSGFIKSLSNAGLNAQARELYTSLYGNFPDFDGFGRLSDKWKKFNPYKGDRDKAMLLERALKGENNLGGIDLNATHLNLQIKRDGNGVPLPFGQQDMAQLNLIEGLDPVILSITPAASVPLFSELQNTVKSASA